MLNVFILFTLITTDSNPGNNWAKLINFKTGDYVPKVKDLNPYKLWYNFENLFIKTCDGLWSPYFM